MGVRSGDKYTSTSKASGRHYEGSRTKKGEDENTDEGGANLKRVSIVGGKKQFKAGCRRSGGPLFFRRRQPKTVSDGSFAQ